MMVPEFAESKHLVYSDGHSKSVEMNVLLAGYYNNTVFVLYILFNVIYKCNINTCMFKIHYDDDTWTSCSLKSPVIRLFD